MFGLVAWHSLRSRPFALEYAQSWTESTESTEFHENEKQFTGWKTHNQTVRLEVEWAELSREYVVLGWGSSQYLAAVPCSLFESLASLLQSPAVSCSLLRSLLAFSCSVLQ